MIIQIQDVVIEIQNDSDKINQYMEAVNKVVTEKNVQLGYLIIDGHPVYENYQDYFKTHINEIRKVEVVVEMMQKLVEETLVTTDHYLANAIPQLRALADEFYQQPSEKTWLKLVDLFEGIQWILETVIKIDAIKDLEKMVSNYEIWNKYFKTVTELNGVIKEAEVAMLNQDSVLIGDILLYEIVSIFEKMLNELKFLSVQGVNGNVS